MRGSWIMLAIVLGGLACGAGATAAAGQTAESSSIVATGRGFTTSEAASSAQEAAILHVLQRILSPGVVAENVALLRRSLATRLYASQPTQLGETRKIGQLVEADFQMTVDRDALEKAVSSLRKSLTLVAWGNVTSEEALRGMIPTEARGGESPLFDERWEGAVVGTRVTVSNPIHLQQVTCMAGHIDIYPWMWECQLQVPFSRDWYTIRAQADVSFHYGTSTPRSVNFADLVPPLTEREMNGIPCARVAYFGENGKFIGCSLGRDHLFPGGVALRAGTEVNVREDGTLEKATLREEQVVGGQPCAAGGIVEFGPDGVTVVGDGYFEGD